MASKRGNFNKSVLISLICLMSLLNMAEMRRVYLRNKFMDGYLVQSNQAHDNERNHVSLPRKAFLWMYSPDSGIWDLVSRENDEYEIIHSSSNEPLYAAGNVLCYDHDRRKVFTWVAGPSVYQGYWKLEKLDNGYYKIKNTYHNEYLYAAKYPSEGWVFTWRDLHSSTNNDKFYWQLIDVQY